MFFLCYLLIILFVFLSVAFITLFERKILGVTGMRFGPSFVYIYGLLQPVFDFLKLGLKRFELLYFLDLGFWIFSPIWGLMLLLMAFMLLVLSSSFTFWEYGLMMLFLAFSLLVYMFFFGGWVSVGIFCYISSLRVIVQMISYEVGFMFMYMYIMYGFVSYDFYDAGGFWFLGGFYFLVLWLVITISECGRAPFDFLEGESELVSGFNLEYLGLSFSLIFLVEYGFLLVSSLFSSYLLLGSEDFFFVFVIFFIFVRGSFPRYRYDYMLTMFWKDVFYSLACVYLILNFLS